MWQRWNWGYDHSGRDAGILCSCQELFLMRHILVIKIVSTFFQQSKKSQCRSPLCVTSLITCPDVSRHMSWRLSSRVLTPLVTCPDISRRASWFFSRVNVYRLVSTSLVASVDISRHVPWRLTSRILTSLFACPNVSSRLSGRPLGRFLTCRVSDVPRDAAWQLSSLDLMSVAAHFMRMAYLYRAESEWD